MAGVNIPPGGVIDFNELRNRKNQAAAAVVPIGVTINIMLAGDRETIREDIEALKNALGVLEDIAKRGAERLDQVNQQFDASKDTIQ